MMRTPRRRTAFTRAGPPTATVPVFKLKLCAKSRGGCGEKFRPVRQMQSMCGPTCAQKHAALVNAKKAAKAALDDRRETRAKLEALKTRPQLEKDVEEAMNRYVRLRDFAAGCISCGRRFAPDAIGGSCDAGHFRSKGSAKHLRFDPRNLHGQCKHCNDYLGGNPTGYRLGLIAKIGLEAVEALECDQAPRKHTKDELRAMRAEYRAKAKQLEKTHE